MEPVSRFVFTESRVRAVREPSALGSVLVRELPDRSINDIRTRPPKLGGIEPAKRVEESCRKVSLVKHPTVEGIEPTTRVVVMERDDSVPWPHIPDGRVPVKPLFVRERKDSTATHVEGIVPTIDATDKRRAVRGRF
jgi:hypothetical protein